MKTILSTLFAFVAFAVAIYYSNNISSNSNNSSTILDNSYNYMLSRVTQLTKQIRPATKNLFANTSNPANSSRTMSSAAAKATTFRGLPVIPDEPLTTTSPRKIQKSFLAIEQSEGAGARVRRSIGTPQLRNFSPFLMLDHFAIPPGAGFPDHPHRYAPPLPSPSLHQMNSTLLTIHPAAKKQ